MGATARRRNRVLVVSLLFVAAAFMAGSAEAAGKGQGKKTPTPANPTPTPVEATPTPAPTVSADLAVTIDGPVAGGHIDGDRTTVYGRFAGPAHTAVVVNDVLAYASQGRFAASDVRLVSGSNAIVAVARTAPGPSAERVIELEASGLLPPLTVSAAPSVGVPPLAVRFSPVYAGSQVRRFTVDVDGDGSVDLEPTDPNLPIEHVFESPGLYLSRFEVTERGKKVHAVTVAILVTSPDELDRAFAEIWSGMNRALVDGDVDGALSWLTPEARAIHAGVFASLLPDMPAIVASSSPPVRVSQSPLRLEYAVTREIEGERRVFFVTAIRDVDGVWRIQSL